MRKCLVVFAICAFACAGVRAYVIYSNIGSGDTFLSSSDLELRGPFVAPETDQAAAFTPGADYLLDEVDMALDYVSGNSTVYVSVLDDSGGVPGTILDQTNIPAPGTPGIVTATFPGTTELDSGQQYWVWLHAYNNGIDWWEWNDQGDTGLKAEKVGGGGQPWIPSSGTTRGAFRVEGTLVPEPGTFVLLSLGAVGLALYRRRKQS